MSTNVLAWIGALIMAAFFYAAGFGAGDHSRNQACLVKEAQQVQKASQALQAEVQRSQHEAQEVAAHVDALYTNYRTLEEKYHVLKKTRTPLLSRPGPACPVSSATARESAQDTGVDDRLSLGAVWLWNRALDPAHASAAVPDAACNALDPSGQACAAVTGDSGISLWDAWDNHLANAQSCAQDRLRMQHLIDYLHTGAAHAD